MKKLEKRAILCLLLAVVLVIGLIYFTVRLEVNGSDWASFYANQHIYSKGTLCVGKVTDREGRILLENSKDGPNYNDDSEIRKATFHVTGDPGFNIATAANSAFRSRMIGYNFVTGTSGMLTNKGREIQLTIDGAISKTAYEALAGRNGFVGVYNWKTGEILAAVSTPTTDPQNPVSAENAPSGTYVNKVLSSSLTPGSTFKLVTSAAAIDTLPDMDNWSFYCTGSHSIGGGTGKITCPRAHGNQDFYSALANSCNCAFAQLAVDIGGETMAAYTEKLGLTTSYDINGIKTKAGSFNFDTYDINVGWGGIGQFEDQVNPLYMMVYMGAIAGNGTAASPVILKEDSVVDKGKDLLGKDDSARKGTVELLSSGTAAQLQQMMRNNVKVTYGDANYAGLDLHAKSGTAEVGTGKTPHSWFTGYSGDYAFVVCVENGGYGASVAGPVAGKVLQDMKDAGYIKES